MSKINDTQIIILDFSGIQGIQTVTAKQGDDKSRFIQIKPVSNGEPLKLSDSESVDFRCLKPDKTSYTAPAFKNDDDTITVKLDKQVLAVPGNVKTDIVISGEDGKILSSSVFIIRVEPSATNGNYIPSKSEEKRQADFDMDGHTVTNLAEPVNNADAATKGYVDNAANAQKEYTNDEISALAQKSQYRLISDITLEEAVKEITVTRDTENKTFKLKKVFILFNGTFIDDPDVETPNTLMQLRFNSGTVYQMYRSMSIANKSYIFWIESERIFKGNINGYKSTYPEDFSTEAQGLSASNKALMSDFAYSSNNIVRNVTSISFGNRPSAPISSKLFAEESRIRIWGVDDDE